MGEEPQPVAADSEKKDEGIFPEIVEEAERILNSSEPLPLIKQHLDKIIAGEDENKLTIFLLLLSGKKWIPFDQKAMIILKGEPAAGKTTLMELTKFFYTKEVGRFSRHALDYSDLSQYEILKLKELGSIDQEDYGISTLKFLSSEDSGFVVEVTERGEDHKFKTTQYSTPPITMITSTTRVGLDSQLERRAWIFNPDESKEQTQRILEWKIRNEHEKDEVALGGRKMTSKEESILVLKTVVARLKPCQVIVPFKKTLLNLLNLGTLRVRGDFDKLLTICKLYAVLLQRTCFPKKERNGEPFVPLYPQNALEILKLVKNPLTAMQSGLERRTSQLVPILRELGYTIENEMLGKEQREEIAKKSGLSESTVRNYLWEWTKRGYMSSDGKRPATYTLLKDLDFIEDQLGGLNFQDEEEEKLLEAMEEEAREVLSNLWRE